MSHGWVQRSSGARRELRVLIGQPGFERKCELVEEVDQKARRQ